MRWAICGLALLSLAAAGCRQAEKEPESDPKPSPMARMQEPVNPTPPPTAPVTAPTASQAATPDNQVEKEQESSSHIKLKLIEEKVVEPGETTRIAFDVTGLYGAVVCRTLCRGRQKGDPAHAEIILYRELSEGGTVVEVDRRQVPHERAGPNMVWLLTNGQGSFIAEARTHRDEAVLQVYNVLVSNGEKNFPPYDWENHGEQ